MQKAFGGKGANQAVAAARAGKHDQVDVTMLGQVGNDSEGNQYLKYLADNKIDGSHIKVLDG